MLRELHQHNSMVATPFTCFKMECALICHSKMVSVELFPSVVDLSLMREQILIINHSLIRLIGVIIQGFKLLLEQIVTSILKTLPVLVLLGKLKVLVSLLLIIGTFSILV